MITIKAKGFHWYTYNRKFYGIYEITKAIISFDGIYSKVKLNYKDQYAKKLISGSCILNATTNNGLIFEGKWQDVSKAYGTAFMQYSCVGDAYILFGSWIWSKSGKTKKDSWTIILHSQQA